MPHGFAGIVDRPFLLPPLIEKPVDIKKKISGKLVFPKTGNSSAKLRRDLRAALPPTVFAVWESVAAAIDADLNAISHAGVCALVAQSLQNFPIDGSFIAKLSLLLIALLDDYARRLQSELVAEVLMDYPAIVCGSRWEHFNTVNRRGL